jgi:hypothetical protein
VGVAVTALALVAGGQTPMVASAKVVAGPARRAVSNDVTVDLGASTGAFRGGDNGFNQADGGVVTGIGDGLANSLTLTVKAPSAGTYAISMRYANDQELTVTHYNPDVMTQQADISVNGATSTHVNFANTYDWNQFWNLTVPVTLRRGTNTLTSTASQLFNFDGRTLGVITTGSSRVGAALRSSSVPNLDRVSVAPFQLPNEK